MWSKLGEICVDLRFLLRLRKDHVDGHADLPMFFVDVAPAGEMWTLPSFHSIFSVYALGCNTVNRWSWHSRML